MISNYRFAAIVVIVLAAAGALIEWLAFMYMNNA